MQAFRPSRHGYRATMDSTERAILARVVADVAELLGEPVGGEPPGNDPADQLPTIDWAAADTDHADSLDDGSHRLPEDPALARLLPPASDDPELAGEMRRLTESSVRTAKAERLHRVWWDLQVPSDRLEISSDAAMSWAGALTDIRLVLAQRLDVTDADAAADIQNLATESPDEVIQALATLYIALSWLQESLIEAMLAELPEDPNA